MKEKEQNYEMFLHEQQEMFLPDNHPQVFEFSLNNCTFSVECTPDNLTQSQSVVQYLPPFTPIQLPNFVWGSTDGEAFSKSISLTYEEIVHWRRNLFKVPSSRMGKALVVEITRMFRAYTDASALESIALKAAMVVPALLLQKPHPKSKVKDHINHLERHLQLWKEGDLEKLMEEGHTIQLQFPLEYHHQNRSAQQIS